MADDDPTLPIFCAYCHGALTVTYEPGEYRQNTWDCPHCGEANGLPMLGEIRDVRVRRLPS